ncbi:hypothetical protein SprV_0200805700 [Sparganum proliferum]
MCCQSRTRIHARTLSECTPSQRRPYVNVGVRIDLNFMHRPLALVCQLTATITAIPKANGTKSKIASVASEDTAKPPHLIFAARQLQEKYQEMQIRLYAIFVKLTEAIDTGNRDLLWQTMRSFGIPKPSTHTVCQLHTEIMARDTDNGTVSESFTVINGVKQGCVLAAVLFSFVFPAMPLMSC